MRANVLTRLKVQYLYILISWVEVVIRPDDRSLARVRVRVCMLPASRPRSFSSLENGRIERRFSKSGRIERELSLEWREKQHVQRKRGRVDWVKIRRSGTRFEGVAWAPVGAPDESLSESTTFAFVLTHISSFPPRWGRDTAAIPAAAKGNANLIFRIRPPLLHDWYWMKNTFRRNAICEGNRNYYIRILRMYNIEDDCAFSSFNIGQYAHNDNCRKAKMEISE